MILTEEPRRLMPVRMAPGPVEVGNVIACPRPGLRLGPALARRADLAGPAGPPAWFHGIMMAGAATRGSAAFTQAGKFPL